RRLNGLVEEGLFELRQYMEKPPRFEYVLTQCGRDFLPVLLAMIEWGNKYFASEGVSVQLIDKETGQIVNPILVDSRNRKPVTLARHVIAPGPAASEGVRRRLADAAEYMSAHGEG